MSRRLERIGSVVRSVVSEAILTRLNDPRIPSLTSVTHVEVSPDLSVAKVHISVMAEDSRQRLCVTALENAAGRIRGMLGERLVARQVPRLKFVLDNSLKQSFETIQAIDAAMAELGEKLPWEESEEGDGARDGVEEDADEASDMGDQTNAGRADADDPGRRDSLREGE